MLGKILIIEHEVDTSDRIAAVVQDLGYEPVQHFTGTRVVAAAYEHAPEFIVFDEAVPGIDVFSVCSQRNLGRELSLIPVIMLSAPDANPSVAGVRIRPNDDLARSFTTIELVEVMNKALALRREHERQGTLGEIHFDVRSDVKSLTRAGDVLINFLTHTSLTERDIRGFRQAFIEMGGNSIEWGHKKCAELVLQCTYRIDRHAVTLVIRDRGPGFDHQAVRRFLTNAGRDEYEDFWAYLDRRRELGIPKHAFGMMLTAGLVDEYRYNDAGNEVTLVKRFART